ncbi:MULTISPECIES: TetR/AcrR family transcriptional regulator [unclassified Luteococcus]|uniref:TetR/AcrR family transcriptional regulator n=1 Tax=unclassified Luteococcus TaxID=2639923 RepID=UPI00313D1BB5
MPQTPPHTSAATAPATPVETPGSAGPALATPRQRELFDALLTTFLQEGFAHFTMDQAAARFHCSKSTMYALGRTADDVLRRVLVSFFREVARRTDLALTSQRSAARALQAYFEAMGAALEPASATFMRDVATHPATRGIYDTNTHHATQKIRQLIERGVADREFRDVPLDFIAQLIELAMEQIQQGRLQGAHPARAYTELGQVILFGLGADKPGSQG